MKKNTATVPVLQLQGSLCLDSEITSEENSLFSFQSVTPLLGRA
jgi:hypothetical protein